MIGGFLVAVKRGRQGALSLGVACHDAFAPINALTQRLDDARQ